jgi:peroxiredoxin
MKIGQEIPNVGFDIFHKDATKSVSLHEYKGKWLILFFYPADFTFVCPTELEDMADSYEQFTNEGCEIISVSTDTTFVHKAWQDNSEAIKKVKFPMAADPTGVLCKTFGTYIDAEGLSLRGTFIIDPDGVVKVLEMHDNGIGRNSSETLRKLQAAKFVFQNGDLVCPARWTPGGKTLRPGLDLVGKI